MTINWSVSPQRLKREKQPNNWSRRRFELNKRWNAQKWLSEIRVMIRNRYCNWMLGNVQRLKTGFRLSRASVKYVFNAETTLFRFLKLPKRVTKKKLNWRYLRKLNANKRLFKLSNFKKSSSKKFKKLIKNYKINLSNDKIWPISKKDEPSKFHLQKSSCSTKPKFTR